MDQNPNEKSRGPDVTWKDKKMTPAPRAEVRALTDLGKAALSATLFLKPEVGKNDMERECTKDGSLR